MARRLLLVLLLAGALVPGAAAATSPGTELGKLVRAAGRGDAAALWPLLSSGAQRRLRPLARFRRGTAVELSEGLGSFAHGSFDTALSQVVDTRLAVAAIAGTRRAEGRREYAAYAAVMRLEHGRWRADLLSPVKVRPLGPSQGTRVGPVMQAAAEVAAPVAVSDGAIWVDGRAIAGKSGGIDPEHVTFYGQPLRPLARGRHVAVAFARAGNQAGAVAWTFSVS
jgi:hypothetical protein